MRKGTLIIYPHPSTLLGYYKVLHKTFNNTPWCHGVKRSSISSVQRCNSYSKEEDVSFHSKRNIRTPNNYLYWEPSKKKLGRDRRNLITQKVDHTLYHKKRSTVIPMFTTKNFFRHIHICKFFSTFTNIIRISQF